jgi:transcriptional regulator of acetoin/glycerol metabolism
MSSSAIHSAGAQVAWETFLGTGRLPAGAVSPEVEASWRRSREAGVDPYAGMATGVLDPAALAELKERKRDLIRVASPFMEDLCNLVAGSSFLVLLFDERGYLLHTVGDPERIRANRDLNLTPGALWSEAEVGTNGAGTALILGRPFQVSGPEHYCRKHHRWTCSGAPIHGPDDEVVGVLDLSGPVDAMHLHTLGLVLAAVAAIRNALALDRRNRELTLLNNRLASVLGTVTDGVVVLDKGGTVLQVNPVTERLLGISDRQASGKRAAELIQDPRAVQDLLEWGRDFAYLELDLRTSAGPLRCLVSGKHLRGETGAIQGAVLFVNPSQKINRLVNRLTGARASFRFEDILGRGEPMQRALRQALLAAGNASNVLLCGESGTGKEMFAQSIHTQSARGDGPFVAVNCGAIPRELIASELFGYQDGAFTGAARGGRPGKFELAASGTLFLDEIGDMPIEQQVALLRVLQERTVTRLGGGQPLPVDVRIICATHKDLRAEVGRGTFRQDLYYRLNVSMIRLPALREHPDDIPELLEAFLAKAGFRGPRPGPEVVQVLRAHAWPGNIREFQNVVERMALAAGEGALGLEHVPEELLAAPVAAAGPAASPLRASLEEEEKAELQRQVRACRGNLSRAAQELGMSRNTLYRKLKKYAL